MGTRKVLFRTIGDGYNDDFDFNNMVSKKFQELMK